MIDLNNCDYKETLSKMSKVDLVVTDPPYDIGIFKPGSGGTLNNLCKLDETLQPVNCITETNFNLQHFCEEIVQVMKKINIYIWCNKKQIVQYFNYFVNQKHCLYDILIWNKSNALPSYANKYLTDVEYCLYFHESGLCFPQNYEDAKTVYLAPINRENKIWKHPTIKPLEFIESMIRNSSKEGDTVFDPFMGSGTTGLACKKNNRNFIGCEINPEYFQIAESRINGNVPKDQLTGLFS